MSDTATPETPTAEVLAQGQEPPKPETDWKAEAKKWESRAKENKTAAERLAAIEEANKTEAQKAADQLATAQKEAADARRDALKFKIASKFKIDDEDAELFLTGDDEESLTKQAERLSAREAERKKNGNHVPREGATSPATEGDDRQAVRAIFGGNP